MDSGRSCVIRNVPTDLAVYIGNEDLDAADFGLMDVMSKPLTTAAFSVLL
jgi:hypothetical protein